MNLTLGVILTVLLLLISHWFPWPMKLHRLAAYTVGSGSILAGAALWLLLSNQAAILWGLITLYVAGGLATVSAYLIDAALRARVLRKVLSNECNQRD